jgi:hypothetical protein
MGAGMTPRPLTLPVLQMQLDQLTPGQGLHLPMAEVERIFGLNDVASGRIGNFAKGHNCAFAWLDTGVQFLKLSV